MKENYIELTELIFDIATNPYNHSSLNLHPREDLPPGYEGRIKVRHADGTIIDDNRFEYNYYIFPNVLSNISRMLNQAIHSEYGYQIFEEDFDQEIIVPAKNPASVLNKIENILSYATKHDSWNYDHFWNADGQIKDKIYLKKSEARYFLDGNRIKYSSKLNDTYDVSLEKQPQETDEQFCERLKNEGKKLNIITSALIKQYKGICAFRVGVLLCRLTKSEISNSKDPAGLQRSRARKLIKQSKEIDNS